jgi:hypothetical protein
VLELKTLQDLYEFSKKSGRNNIVKTKITDLFDAGGKDLTVFIIVYKLNRGGMP